MQDVLWTLFSSEPYETESVAFCTHSGLGGLELDSGWDFWGSSQKDLLWELEQLSEQLFTMLSLFELPLVMILCSETLPSASTGILLLCGLVLVLFTSVLCSMAAENDCGISYKTNQEINHK